MAKRYIHKNGQLILVGAAPVCRRCGEPKQSKKHGGLFGHKFQGK